MNTHTCFGLGLVPAFVRRPHRTCAIAMLMLGAVFAVPASANDECAAFPIENRIAQLGGSRTSFAQGTYLDSPQTLREQFIKYESDIRQVLASHQLGHIADAVFRAVDSGDGVTDGAVRPGDDFQWLAWRRGSSVVTTSPVCLSTSRDYESFELAVSVDEGSRVTTHRFSIPKICMNIAYLGSESEAKPAPPPPPPAAMTAPAPEPAPVAVPAPETGLIGFFGPFIGFENRTRDLCNCIDDVDSALAGFLGGVRVPVSDRSHLLFQVGAAANLRESKWSTVFADVGMEFDVGERGFIGAGVGLWDINDSQMRDTTVFVQGGGHAWNWRQRAVQWFVQGRTFLDSDDVEDRGTDYAVLAGLRVLFD